MAINIYSIDDLEDILGLSYDQLRARIVNLRGNFEGCVEKGKRGKFLVTDKGLQILKQINVLENEGHSFKTATKVIKEELDKPDANGDKTTSKVAQIRSELVQELQAKIEYLEVENRQLWNQLEEKDRQIQQLLPGSTDNKGIIRKIWTRIW